MTANHECASVATIIQRDDLSIFYSYSGILKNPRAKNLKVSARRDGETVAGYVTVCIENGELTKSNTNTELQFAFVSEAVIWKLAEIPSY
jgi:hypothetical protein